MSVNLQEENEFVAPKRAVFFMEDMQLWQNSEAYLEYIRFIVALNEAVKGRSLSAECPVSDITKGVVALLDSLHQWLLETPPIVQTERFGNQSYRSWYVKLKEGALELLETALPEEFHKTIPEIIVYLTDGFGDSTRIEYGIGHELSFLMFMYCLFKIGVLKEEDKTAAVTHIFNRYLLLVRKLQLTYRMIPAGSRGVWSLDDYQFVPFMWGSAQLIAHPEIEPRSFLEQDVVDSHAKDYMFLGCIQFINKVKTGSFAETSNQLWNISAVPSWSKINGGLIKMYRAEILGKFPVIKNVLFGSLLPFRIARSMNVPQPNPAAANTLINPISAI